MHNNKIFRGRVKLTEIIVRIFSALFWILVMLGLDGVNGAILTIIAVVIHEFGHIIALFILGHGGGVPLPRMPGFSINVRATLSYK